MLLQIGFNDTDFPQLRHNTVKNIGKDTTNIGKKCREGGVVKVIISFVLVKNNVKVTKFIRQLNEILRHLCTVNDFSLFQTTILRETLFVGMVYILIKMVHVPYQEIS